MCWKIKQATKLLTSGNCILFCCLIPFSLFPFLFFFSKHFALKVRGGKKCRRVEKIEKLETNFKNFALTGRKKAQQTNYRKLIVERGVGGLMDKVTEWLSGWLTTGQAWRRRGKGRLGKGERRVVLRRRNVKTNVTASGRSKREREGGGGAFLCCCRRDVDAGLPAAVICFCCSCCCSSCSCCCCCNCLFPANKAPLTLPLSYSHSLSLLYSPTLLLYLSSTLPLFTLSVPASTASLCAAHVACGYPA